MPSLVKIDISCATMSVKYKARPCRAIRRFSVKDLPITRLELLESLYTHTFDTFYIEYNGYFSNCLVQNCIALYHMGGSKEKFQSFVEHYISQLEPLHGPTRQRQDLGLNFQEVTLQELQGRRGGYYKIRKHYHVILANKYEDNLDELLRGELPPLILGISAIHAVEIVGYAYSINSAELVCDGLAYLYHSYWPVILKKEHDWMKFGMGNWPLLEVLEKIGGDFELSNFILRRRRSSSGDVLKQRIEMSQTDLQLYLKDRGDSLMEYVFKIKLPFEALKSPDEILKYILDQIILVYVRCESRNNTHILGVISSGWALLQLLPLIKETDMKLQLICVHICTFLAIYLSQGKPKLMVQASSEPTVTGMTWDKILESLLALPVSIDHNIYRLVQVCYLRGLKNMDIRTSELYKRACLSTMELDGMKS